MAHRFTGFVMAALLGAWSGAAVAQEGAGASSSEASLSVTGEGVSASGTSAGRPTDNYLELGLSLGALFPSSNHNFHDEKKPHQELKLAPEFAGRIGYYPIGFVGLELEGMMGFSKSADDSESATPWAVRGHAVGQMPMPSVTPFVLMGFGRLGAKSDSLGSDTDPAFHFGAGVKVPIGDLLGVRFDLRDNMTQKNGGKDGDQTHSPEVMLGLTFTFGFDKKEPPPPPPPKDTDGDGFVDTQDKCPTVAGIAPDGCPPADSDKDGILDPDDKCPQEAGVPPDGCPDKDADKDGVLIPEDKCPTEKGPKPDGCPDLDPDRDGVMDPADKCPTQPETKNGFEDADGCPDEIPEAVKKFTGVIQGIEFDFGKATIRPKSKPTLDEAVKVLKDYPTTRIEISGHTDDVGPRERNLELSQKRAESVKEYMVSQGIDASRIDTRGAGPDQPIADNKKADGRQKNRRIEFKLVQ